MKWKIGVRTAEAGDEVVLEGADDAFGRVAAMDVRWRQLVVNGLLRQVLLEGL